MANLIEVRVPDIGDFHDVPVIELPVAQGDAVAEGDTIVVLESDKATLDVPSPTSGRIARLVVEVGQTVSEGGLLLTLETDQPTEVPVVNEEAGDAPVDPAPTDEDVAEVAAAAPTANGGDRIYASPAIRGYARKLGVALDQVGGSGPNGRITREDVEAFVKRRLSEAPVGAPASAQAPPTVSAGLDLPDWPVVDFAKFGSIERQPLSRIAKISGPALARNALVIPHVTNFDRADITELEAFRQSLNEAAEPSDAKMTIVSFVVKAAVAALKAFPAFNASLDGDELILKKYWHIGVAVNTPGGLLVPVINDADRKGLREIAGELAGLAAQAREGKLKPTDMQGATLTISSLGGIGGTNFAPIINAPEVAILGMTRSEMQPVWDGNDFRPRLMQPLSLSWDHRAVDGVAAAQFLAHMAATLSDFRRAVH